MELSEDQFAEKGPGDVLQPIRCQCLKRKDRSSAEDPSRTAARGEWEDEKPASWRQPISSAPSVRWGCRHFLEVADQVAVE